MADANNPVPTDTGKVYGPTREDFERGHPVQGPTREDYDRNVHPDLQRERKEKQEADKKREAADLRERNRAEKRNAEREQEKAEKEAARKEREAERQKKKNRMPRGGIEIPKQGVGRLANTTKRINQKPLLSQGIDFSGQFSGGLRVESGLSLKGSGLKPASIKKPAKTTQGYGDPFSGLNRISRKNMSPTRSLTEGIFAKPKPGRKPKRSLFNLRLF